MSFGRFMPWLYREPDGVAAQRDALLGGEGPAPLVEPVEWCSRTLLGLAPEAREQIRRDRDRLIDAVRD